MTDRLRSSKGRGTLSRRGGFARAAAVLLFALAAVSGAGAQELGSGQFQILGTSFDISPETQAVPPSIPTVVHTSLPAPAGVSLPADLVVRGELRGPGLGSTTLSLTTTPNADFLIPAMTVRGEYVLSDIRLTQGGRTITYATHRDAVIVVTDILITQVTSTQLTYQEIVDLGIVIGPANFSGYSNKTKETDAEGNETKWEYNIKGEKIAEIDSNWNQADPLDHPGRTEWTYDGAGRVETMTDANGRKTQYFYDSEGNLTKELRIADGAFWTFTYDENNNRASATDARLLESDQATVVTYGYDEADRLVSKTIERKPGILGPASVAFTRDAVGRVTGSATGEGVVETFVYDSLDRQLSEDLTIPGGTQWSVARSFDETGNLIGMSTPAGLDLAYDIDGLGRIHEIGSGGIELPILSYTDTGLRLTGKTLKNGIKETWSYNPRRYLEGIKTTFGTTPEAVVRDVIYNRSDIGNKNAVEHPALGKQDTYTYNANSWITAEKLNLSLDVPPVAGPSTVATSYTIDKVLNYADVTRNGVTTNNTLNNRNQYVAVGTEPLTYDANGNLKTYAGKSLEYDYENRLAKATLPGGTTIENLYDAQGRKVQELLTVGGITKKTNYVLSGDQVVEEYVNGTLNARYVHGRGIDELVQVEQSSAGNGTLDRTIFPIQDELGNVERITDANGATLERYEYEGYGKVRIFAPDNTPRSVSAYGWKWLFQGREYQPQLGAYDFRARTLWPELGRFGQEDPMGATDSTNLNQALLGNYQRFADPLGLHSSDLSDTRQFIKCKYHPDLSCSDYLPPGEVDVSTHVPTSSALEYIRYLRGQGASDQEVWDALAVYNTGSAGERNILEIARGSAALEGPLKILWAIESLVFLLPVDAPGAILSLGLSARSLILLGSADDAALAIVQFSDDGWVILGSLDELGRPTGITANVTGELVGTGSRALGSIRPPGFLGGAANLSRGHLLGRQLGGTGDDVRNLVTLFQNPANSPVMRGFEAQVRKAVEAGEIVRYRVLPMYKGAEPMPSGITIDAIGSQGFRLHITVLNQ